MTNINPLLDEQEEKKGAETIGKYDYQYHWALYRMLELHKSGNEYVVFVELHQDVLIANSLDPNSSKFEMYQIKENSGSGALSVKDLSRVDKGNKNSLLGKMILSLEEKSFIDSVTSLNLVATGKFNKNIQKDEALDLEIVPPSEMSLDLITALKKICEEELSIKDQPANIHFIIPKLSPQNVESQLIGEVGKLFQDHQWSQPLNIYRALIDTLYRIGKIRYDFLTWDSLLASKGITSNEVSAVISQHSQIIGLSDIIEQFSILSSELELNYLQSGPLRRSVERWHINSVVNPNTYTNKINALIEDILIQNDSQLLPETNLKDLINQVTQEMNLLFDKGKIERTESLEAAIVCSIIKRAMGND